MPRNVIPGEPHHVTQRGNRNQRTFFERRDYETYLYFLEECCRRFDVVIWAYCLMPNHIHLIAVPGQEDSLRLAIGSTHEQYSKVINFRNDWRGHLWQGRFFSNPMDAQHALLAARYIERNPVAAGIAADPMDYEWSSARAHESLQSTEVFDAKALGLQVRDWREFLGEKPRYEDVRAFQKHVRTGRALGTIMRH